MYHTVTKGCQNGKSPEKCHGLILLVRFSLVIQLDHTTKIKESMFMLSLLFNSSGLALCQVIFVYSLSNNGPGNSNLLENYHKLAQPIHSLYYMLFAICTVSVFDRCVVIMHLFCTFALFVCFQSLKPTIYALICYFIFSDTIWQIHVLDFSMAYSPDLQGFFRSVVRETTLFAFL